MLQEPFEMAGQGGKTAPAQMTIVEIVTVEEALMRDLRAAYQLYEAIRWLLDHLKSAKLP